MASLCVGWSVRGRWARTGRGGRRIHIGHARIELLEVGFPEIAYYLGIVSWRPLSGEEVVGRYLSAAKAADGDDHGGSRGAFSQIVKCCACRCREDEGGGVVEVVGVCKGGACLAVATRSKKFEGRGRAKAGVARRSDQLRRKLSPTFGGCVRRDSKH
jgi:hypothetical protein